jgi:hypothetical protein
MSKKVNYRKKYQEELITFYNENNMFYDKDIIKSIMSKVAINSKNKYGKVDFEEEMIESGIVAGQFFYDEIDKKDTYNRRNK